MKQEDKQLLLKDLCARLNCGVKAHYKYYDFIGGTEQLVSEDDAIITGVNTTLGNPIQVDGYYVEVEYVKPYLRPMSSMTDEEKNRWWKLSNLGGGYALADMAKVFDYLNSIHVDYRDLIEKGLAIEAPKGMYK